MNKKNYILALIALFVIAIGFSSCEEDDDYTTDYNTGIPPTVTASVVSDSITDYTTYINVSSNQDGYVHYAVIASGSEPETIEGYEIVLEDLNTAVAGLVKVEANTATLVEIAGLDFASAYVVYVVSTNAAGQSGTVVGPLSLTTTDTKAPVVADFTPFGQSPRVAADQPMIVTFDEPIAGYDETKTVRFWSYFYGVDEIVPVDSMTISGNQVIVTMGLLPYNDYCFLEFEEGAFYDYSGNVCAVQESGVVGGSLVGLWFRVERDPATQLPTIFENFLGDYVATDYDNSDSTTVDWGPYGVTISENTETEEPYDVIIDGFWGWGSGSTFVVTFNTDYTISAQTQELAVTLGNVYGDPFTDEPIYCGIWSPDTYATPYGTWSYSDFSFDMSLLFYNDEYGQVYSDIYQSYIKDDGTKSLKSDRSQLTFKK